MLATCLLFLILARITQDASVSAPAALVVTRRSIDPSLVIVQRLWPSGEYERIETTPMMRTLERVLRGHIDDPASLLSALDRGGFFTWADSSLLPPRGIDVESDPIHVSLTYRGRTRALGTREPMIPDPLRGVLAALESTSTAAAPAQSCIVCECGRILAGPSPAPAWSSPAKHPWSAAARAALEAHVAFSLSLAEAQRVRLPSHQVVVRSPDGACGLRCLKWRPPIQE